MGMPIILVLTVALIVTVITIFLNTMKPVTIVSLSKILVRLPPVVQPLL